MVSPFKLGPVALGLPGFFRCFMDSATIAQILPKLSSMPIADQVELLKLLEGLEDAKGKERAQSNFLPFVKRMWPGFIEGPHHRIMADTFDRVISGECKRVIINMAPRHTKSEFASYLLPAYFMGKYPEKKIIQATHTAELAVDFGRKVRNLIKDEAFSDVFPGVGLRADSTASGRWNTTSNGAYFAVGVGGAIAGKGADLFIIDDPHSEQEAIQAAHDPKVFEKVYEWYSSGPRQRLQPNAAIVVVMTRWGVGDLTGRLVQASIDRGDGDQWEVIELPAILPSGEPMWPAFWSKPALEALKSELPASKWNAQYQQKPTSEGGAILKREWWRRWDKKRMPQCEYIIIASDTAFTKNNRSDYSAFTVWGVFENEGEGGSNIIMLDAWKDRLEFPDLKAKAIELYKEWEPDTFLIEAKASGLPLIHELRKAGVMVSEFTPTRASGDKVMRANSISDIFASGVVWAPTGNWANEVIEECASFPVGAHDDYVDTVIMALMRYRQGGLLRLPSDDEDDYTPQTRAEYY